GSTGPPEVDFADADWLAQANESARMIVRMRLCRLSEKYDASDFKNGAVFECYLRIQWTRPSGQVFPELRMIYLAPEAPKAHAQGFIFWQPKAESELCLTFAVSKRRKIKNNR